MPSTVIMSQLCPRGMEATMFALLAGCHNLGATISSNFGAVLLEWLAINPSGAKDESVQFQNLVDRLAHRVRPPGGVDHPGAVVHPGQEADREHPAEGRHARERGLPAAPVAVRRGATGHAAGRPPAAVRELDDLL